MTSRTGDSKKSSNVTPDKEHRKNLVTSSKFWKYTESYGSKPYYKGSDNSYTESSHGEENI